MEEQLKEFTDLYKRVPSRMSMMRVNGSIEDILHSLGEPEETVVAFDFDQTITEIIKVPGGPAGGELRVRGGDASVRALRGMHSKGIPMCIVTAQPTTEKVVKNMRADLRQLGLADVFDVEEFEPAPLLSLLKSWGKNYEMSLERLTRKLIALIVNDTERYPSDLQRIGYLRTTFYDVLGEAREDYNAKVNLAAQQKKLALLTADRLKQEAEEKRIEDAEKAAFDESIKDFDEEKKTAAKVARKNEWLLASDAKGKKEAVEATVEYRLPIVPKIPKLISRHDIPARVDYPMADMTLDAIPQVPEIDGKEKWNQSLSVRAVSRRLPPLLFKTKFEVDESGAVKTQIINTMMNDDASSAPYFMPEPSYEPPEREIGQYHYRSDEKDPLLCPVRCWLAYLERTMPYRSQELDRLFLDSQNSLLKSRHNQKLFP